MAFNLAKFLIELLGPGGARALAKASDRSEQLGTALVPRTIVAWLRSVDQFDGEIPGSDVEISFRKSEAGFNGYVELEKGSNFELDNASLVRVAGAISVALGLDSSRVPGEIRRLDLEKLGKSVDLMVKAEQTKKNTCAVCGGKGGKHEDRLVGNLVLPCRNAVKKGEMPESAGQSRPEESSAGDAHGETSRQEIFQKAALNAGGGAGGGGGGTGQPAGPVAPAAPAAPTASAPKMSIKQTLPKPAKSATPPGGPSVKLTRSEQAALCQVCGRPQFDSGEFTGCLCFSSLAKSATVVAGGDVVEVRFGSDWDKASILTLLEAVGRK